MVALQFTALLKYGTTKRGDNDMSDDLIAQHWSNAWAHTEAEMRERLGDDGMAQPFRSANARNPEDKNWWYINGLQMLKSWVAWRSTTDWKIWELPDGSPAVELTMNIELGGVPIKMTLDRVMVTPNGELVVVDVKTGSRKPDSQLQLGFYAVGVEITYGVRPTLGAYWMARKGVTTEPESLEHYTVDRLTKLVTTFDRARKEGIFLPNFNHCIRCGYKVHCEWYPKEI